MDQQSLEADHFASAPATPAISPTASPAPSVQARGVPAWLAVLTAAVACVALAWLLSPNEMAAASTLQIVYRVCLTVAGLLVLGIVAVLAWRQLHDEKVSGRQLQRMLDILPRIRTGELAIEELKLIEGTIAPLAEQVQQLLHELRQQRTEVAHLEHELSQRVASRTNALERTIGSLRQQAIRDPMTGLFNRRLLDQHLPPILERCRKMKNHLSLLMIDVDYFKTLNDTLGHAAGDDLLRDIAAIIRSTIRDSDVAFRYGGDEFVVVLEGFDAEAGQALGDRLISLVDALTKTYRVDPKPRLCIGVATLRDLDSITPSALLQEADRLLYEEKRSRKNSRTLSPIPPGRLAV